MVEKIQKKEYGFCRLERFFDKGKVEIVNIGNTTVGKASFEPGWSGKNV